MSIIATTADESLREAVTSQLIWTPEVDASMIGVAAHDGIVTLTGFVKTYAAKLAAERTARRVYGTKAVANDLQVKIASERIDPEIARDAVDALRTRDGIPSGIDVTVRNAHIVLSGVVDWHFQRQAAERTVRYLRGVRGVINDIVVKPSVSETDVQKHIVAALHREVDIDAHRIRVTAQGDKVTLTGRVRSWTERQQAERAAWSTAGVAKVDNFIDVAP